MSQSMDYGSRGDTVVDRYFNAWRDHEVHVLKEIFGERAEYKINGRVAYVGVPDIESYWRRNEARQTRLQIQYGRIAARGDKEQVHFLSSFYDVSESEWQSVAGIINFMINEDKTQHFGSF
jgi:hypothetical protein